MSTFQVGSVVNGNQLSGFRVRAILPEKQALAWARKIAGTDDARALTAGIDTWPYGEGIIANPNEGKAMIIYRAASYGGFVLMGEY